MQQMNADLIRANPPYPCHPCSIIQKAHKENESKTYGIPPFSQWLFMQQWQQRFFVFTDAYGKLLIHKLR